MPPPEPPLPPTPPLPPAGAVGELGSPKPPTPPVPAVLPLTVVRSSVSVDPERVVDTGAIAADAAGAAGRAAVRSRRCGGDGVAGHDDAFERQIAEVVDPAAGERGPGGDAALDREPAEEHGAVRGDDHHAVRRAGCLQHRAGPLDPGGRSAVGEHERAREQVWTAAARHADRPRPAVRIALDRLAQRALAVSGDDVRVRVDHAVGLGGSRDHQQCGEREEKGTGTGHEPILCGASAAAPGFAPRTCTLDFSDRFRRVIRPLGLGDRADAAGPGCRRAARPHRMARCSRISPSVAAASPRCSTVAIPSARAVLRLRRQVVDVDAVRRRETEPLGGELVDLRVGLAQADLAGDHPVVEQLREHVAVIDRPVPTELERSDIRTPRRAQCAHAVEHRRVRLHAAEQALEQAVRARPRAARRSATSNAAAARSPVSSAGEQLARARVVAEARLAPRPPAAPRPRRTPRTT